MSFGHAITRKPGPDFASGITAAVWKTPPVYDRIRKQHEIYNETLRALGVHVTVLAPAPGFPDAYFVEDTAIMLPGTVMMTRPGALSRRGETDIILPVLQRFMPVTFIQAPGFLDGGDVMRVENHFFIGLSDRTNLDGARQLETAVVRQGLSCTILPVQKHLHLKSGINYLGRNTMIMVAEYAETPAFTEYEKIIVDADESPATNTLAVNDTLLTPKGFPKARRKLDACGMPVVELEIDEVIKMDGGLSCLSLRF